MTMLQEQLYTKTAYYFEKAEKHVYSMWTNLRWGCENRQCTSWLIRTKRISLKIWDESLTCLIFCVRETCFACKTKQRGFNLFLSFFTTDRVGAMRYILTKTTRFKVGKWGTLIQKPLPVFLEWWLLFKNNSWPFLCKPQENVVTSHLECKTVA